MATIHLGRQCGDVGFSRIVVIKRLLQQCYWDPDFIAMFVDEARLAARIQHPNVVSTLDVVSTEDELLLVLEYIHGESLWSLLGDGKGTSGQIPRGVASTIVCDALHGLHAVHNAKDRHGRPLHIVHRDVSPQNILVGADGVARVLDFGIAKASDSARFTLTGSVRGKVAYLAPEQITQEEVTQRVDLFAMGVVLWELLTGKRLFSGGIQAVLAKQALGQIESPREIDPTISPELEAVVMKALAINPAERFQSGREMAEAVERACPLGTREEVANWVQIHAGRSLMMRSKLIAQLERRGESMRASAMPVSHRRWNAFPGQGESMVEQSFPAEARVSEVTTSKFHQRSESSPQRESFTAFQRQNHALQARLTTTLLVVVLVLAGALTAYLVQALLQG